MEYRVLPKMVNNTLVPFTKLFPFCEKKKKRVNHEISSATQNGE